MKKRFIETGVIANTHGIKGEVKIVPWSDGPEFLLDFDTLYIDERPLSVASARISNKNVLMSFVGVNDINAAMRLKGKVVCIDRADARLPEGRHFLSDLIGLQVRKAPEGKVLGTLTEVLTLPAHPVYTVRGEKEYLIPAVDEFIIETNLDGGYMLVRLIEGMGE